MSPRLSESIGNVWWPGSSTGWPLLLLLFLPLVAGCAPRSSSLPGNTLHRIKSVPFYPDDRYKCGPASLAGVLNYWGKDRTKEEIARRIYSQSAQGTVPFDLVWYARQTGLRARSFQGTYRQLRRYVRSDKPPIVFVDLGYWGVSIPHFMVVVGTTRNGLIVNSGTHQHKWYSREEFVRAWKETDRWTLLVTPDPEESLS